MFRGEYDISTEITAFAAYGRHQSSIFGTRLVVGGVASDGSYRGGFSLQDSAFKIRTGEAGLRTNFTTGAV